MINFSLKEAERTVAKWKGEKSDEIAPLESPKTVETKAKKTEEKPAWECPKLAANLDTVVHSTDVKKKAKIAEKSDETETNNDLQQLSRTGSDH